MWSISRGTISQWTSIQSAGEHFKLDLRLIEFSPNELNWPYGLVCKFVLLYFLPFHSFLRPTLWISFSLFFFFSSGEAYVCVQVWKNPLNLRFFALPLYNIFRGRVWLCLWSEGRWSEPDLSTYMYMGPWIRPLTPSSLGAIAGGCLSLPSLLTPTCLCYGEQNGGGWCIKRLFSHKGSVKYYCCCCCFTNCVWHCAGQWKLPSGPGLLSAM